MSSAITDLDASSPRREVVLRPEGAGRLFDAAELWRYRDLLWRLGLRDIQVRYKQTLLGAGWAVVQPVVMMVVFSLVFGRMLGVATNVKAPYPIFVYAGLLPWTFFTAAVSASSLSLVSNAGMLRKIYFPRLLMPLSAMLAPLADLLIAFVVLGGMMLWYGVDLNWGLMLLPAAVASVVLAAAGVGTLLAALTVSYRDIKHVIPFLIQVWLFVTPVIYPLDLADQWAWLLGLNPMAGPISAFRAMVLGNAIDVWAWMQSIVVSLAVLGLALWMFARSERRFADVV